MRDSYFRAGDGFVIVYDITKKSSFDHVQAFYNQIVKAKEADDFPIVLIGMLVFLLL